MTNALAALDALQTAGPLHEGFRDQAHLSHNAMAEHTIPLRVSLTHCRFCRISRNGKTCCAGEPGSTVHKVIIIPASLHYYSLLRIITSRCVALFKVPVICFPAGRSPSEAAGEITTVWREERITVTAETWPAILARMRDSSEAERALDVWFALVPSGGAPVEKCDGERAEKSHDGTCCSRFFRNLKEFCSF